MPCLLRNTQRHTCTPRRAIPGVSLYRKLGNFSAGRGELALASTLTRCVCWGCGSGFPGTPPTPRALFGRTPSYNQPLRYVRTQAFSTNGNFPQMQFPCKWGKITCFTWNCSGVGSPARENESRLCVPVSVEAHLYCFVFVVVTTPGRLPHCPSSVAVPKSLNNEICIGLL